MRPDPKTPRPPARWRCSACCWAACWRCPPSARRSTARLPPHRRATTPAVPRSAMSAPACARRIRPGPWRSAQAPKARPCCCGRRATRPASISMRGCLVEEYAAAGSALAPQNAQIIARTGSFSAAAAGGLYTVHDRCGRRAGLPAQRGGERMNRHRNRAFAVETLLLTLFFLLALALLCAAVRRGAGNGAAGPAGDRRRAFCCKTPRRSCMLGRTPGRRRWPPPRRPARRRQPKLPLPPTARPPRPAPPNAYTVRIAFTPAPQPAGTLLQAQVDVLTPAGERLAGLTTAHYLPAP